jgi:hypothetical protein
MAQASEPTFSLSARSLSSAATVGKQPIKSAKVGPVNYPNSMLISLITVRETGLKYPDTAISYLTVAIVTFPSHGRHVNAHWISLGIGEARPHKTPIWLEHPVHPPSFTPHIGYMSTNEI